MNSGFTDKELQISAQLSKLIMLLAVMIAMLGLTSCTTKAGLEKKITKALEEKYGMEFVCVSVSVNGGGADFVCYPSNDPTLLFDGFADSEDGSIGWDYFTGAIFAKEDTRIMTELLSDRFGEVYVYGTPEHLGGSYASSVIRRGNYTLEDLKDGQLSPNIFFYIFVDTSSDMFVDDSSRDYDALSESVNEMVDYYRETFERNICVDMHIYYVEKDDISFAKEYFKTHVSVFFDFNKQISPQYLITLQMGPEENGYYHSTWRLTEEEYSEKRSNFLQ